MMRGHRYDVRRTTYASTRRTSPPSLGGRRSPGAVI
jgi:hypothetical protein